MNTGWHGRGQCISTDIRVAPVFIVSDYPTSTSERFRAPVVTQPGMSSVTPRSEDAAVVVSHHAT